MDITHPAILSAQKSLPVIQSLLYHEINQVDLDLELSIALRDGGISAPHKDRLIHRFVVCELTNLILVILKLDAIAETEGIITLVLYNTLHISLELFDSLSL